MLVDVFVARDQSSNFRKNMSTTLCIKSEPANHMICLARCAKAPSIPYPYSPSTIREGGIPKLKRSNVVDGTVARSDGFAVVIV